MEKKKSLIVELAGPAGAGKTTTRNALIERNRRVQYYPHPYFRERQDMPFFAWNLLAISPLLARMAMVKDGLKITREESANMVILHGWANRLRRQAARSQGILLLDQGPVYFLAVKAFFSSPAFKFPILTHWWEYLYEKWAKTMDVIVLLDTADEVLIERINTRGKWHQMLGKDEDTAEEFLQQSRESLEETIEMLRKRNPEIQILKFNTREKSVDQIYGEITAFLESRLA